MIQETTSLCSSEVTVQTVLGPISSGDLGITLMHEHLFQDLREAVHPARTQLGLEIAKMPVSADNAWLLREDPYISPDNCQLNDEEITCEELAILVNAGGRTIIDNSTGPGRDPEALRRVAKKTGLNVIMGSGWCFAHGNDDSLSSRAPESLADELVVELSEGVEIAGGVRVRPGIIGEIGVGPNFTASERVTLIASAMAQIRTGVPLLIHLPGWQRRAHEVLDIVIAQGVSPAAIVLCHMDPSGKDKTYQLEVADRGVWLEFDMIGMPFNFIGEGESPSVGDTAEAVINLIVAGYANQILLSQDVFLKGMWTRYGGNGYGFVPGAFIPRLIEGGVDGTLAAGLITKNPAAVFVGAARGVIK